MDDKLHARLKNLRQRVGTQARSRSVSLEHRPQQDGDQKEHGPFTFEVYEIRRAAAQPDPAIKEQDITRPHDGCKRDCHRVLPRIEQDLA